MSNPFDNPGRGKPGGPGGGQGGGQGGRAQYEFNEDQNRIIGGLATRMGIVGTITLVAGVLLILASGAGLFLSLGTGGALPEALPAEVKAAMGSATSRLQSLGDLAWYGALAGLFEGLILLALGVFARRGAGRFRAVVNTRGDDITHMMGALDAQRRLFGVVATLLVLAVLIGVANTGFQLWQQYGHQLPF